MASLPRHQRRASPCSRRLRPSGVEVVETPPRDQLRDIPANDRVIDPPIRLRQGDQRQSRIAAVAPIGDALPHDQPLIAERGLHHLPACALLAQQIFGGHPGVVDEYFVEMPLARDLVDGANLDLLLPHRAKHEGKASMLGHVPIGTAEQQAIVRAHRARGPDLLPVDDIMIALAVGTGAHSGQVRSSARLAVEQAEGGRPRDEAAEHFFCAPHLCRTASGCWQEWRCGRLPIRAGPLF
jgi:hypothetical protein